MVSLGENQYDLAVLRDGLDEVEEFFLDVTFCRLDLSADPLLIGRNRTPRRGLRQILEIYIQKREGLHGAELSWVDAEIKHLEARIEEIS